MWKNSGGRHIYINFFFKKLSKESPPEIFHIRRLFIRNTLYIKRINYSVKLKRFKVTLLLQTVTLKRELKFTLDRYLQYSCNLTWYLTLTKIDESKRMLLVVLIGLARFSYVTVPVWVAEPASPRADLGTERHPSPGRLWYIGSTLHLASAWTRHSTLRSHVAQTVDTSRGVELRFDKVHNLARRHTVAPFNLWNTRPIWTQRRTRQEFSLSSSRYLRVHYWVW